MGLLSESSFPDKPEGKKQCHHENNRMSSVLNHSYQMRRTRLKKQCDRLSKQHVESQSSYLPYNQYDHQPLQRVFQPQHESRLPAAWIHKGYRSTVPWFPDVSQHLLSLIREQHQEWHESASEWFPDKYYPNDNRGDPTSDYVRKAILHAVGYIASLPPLYLPFPVVLSNRAERTRAKEDRADEQSPDNQPLP